MSTKISEMTAATVVNDTDLVPIVQGGANKKVSGSLFRGQYFRTGQNRFYYGQVNGLSLTSVTLSANNIRAIPIVIERNITILEIAGHVNSAIAATNFRLAIYADDGNAYPGAIVAGTDAAEHSSASTGIKTSGTISITLTPGLYWLAYNTNGGATLYGVNLGLVNGLLGIPNTLGGSNFSTGYTVAQAYGAMPASYPAGATAAPVGGVLAFRV